MEKTLQIYKLILFSYCLCFLITYINGENPDRLCPAYSPYFYENEKCSNFQEICYKEGDKHCDKLQKECKQCPPSNFTMIALKQLSSRITDIELISTELRIMLRTITARIEIRNEGIIGIKNKSSGIAITILIFIIILVCLMILLLFKSKRGFRRMRQFCSTEKRMRQFRSTEKSWDYDAQGHLYSFHKDDCENILKELKNLITQMQKRDEIPLNSASTSNNFTFLKIQFHLDGIDQEPIELYVHNNHNIVQVKQQIYAKLPHPKHDDYKIMKLKYNGNILNDNNQYLLEYIDKSNTIVNCFIDSSMNASDIVVVKLQGKMRLPDIIQINKNQTIDQLKELIGKIINSKDFSLFKLTNGKFQTEELKDNLNKLYDGDWIRIVTKVFGKLIIRSIFDDLDSITIEYVNVDLVSSLMKSISNKFHWDLNNFVLFYNNKYLDPGKYIFEYQISSESAAKYCCFMKWAGINMDDVYINQGNFSELRYGTFEKSDRKILIKKYEVKASKTWKDEEFMLKELITFQITKYHRRFIQLLGVYIDDTILYVVMENMDGGTLKLFLQENYEKLDKSKIYKFSAQILEGLKFLHENKVIHRDLNPSSILVDGNEDLKLSSFNLSKYLDIYKPSSIMAKRDKKEELPVRYMAPEILNSDKYGEACDVWSFGAVLIRIVTNRKPYYNSNKSEALYQISKLKMIEYKLPDKYSEFKSIIDSCLKYDPSQRVKIGKLIENEMIGKYIIY